jgi:LptA/(LptD N-terminal domain) LPS transport protein
MRSQRYWRTTIRRSSALGLVLLGLLGGAFVQSQTTDPNQPVQPAPTEPAPTEPAPTEPAPTEPAPTEPTPATPAAPTEPTAPTPATPASAVNPEKPFEEFPPTFELVRKDKTILAVKFGPNDKGTFTICPPKDEDKDRRTRVVIVDLEPYLVHITIDKNIVKAPVTFITKEENGDGSLEAYNGTYEEITDVCLPKIKADPKPNTVFVEQGKTRLTGSRMDYSQETGIAVIAGPIIFERPQKNDKLTGTSEKITVDVDGEKTFLEGNVVLKSKCRTSNATKVEYNDKRNLAILFGKPAVSIQTDVSGKQIGEVRGERIEYNLETNDVVVTFGQAKGTVEAPLSVFADDSKPCE